MKYRTFGKLGWKVSEIGFGAWAIGGDMWGPQSDHDSVAALNLALDRGVTFIDTAQGYGNGHSEEIVGRVLQGRSELVYVATKVPALQGSPWPIPLNAGSEGFFPKDYVIRRCEESLKRLKRDAIDLYQFHTWTAAFNMRDEIFEAMEILKDEGKIRAVGVSVPDTNPDCVIASLVRGNVDAVQLIYNIFEQNPRWNILPVAEKLSTAIIVRVPFDEGALTGKYSGRTTFPEGDMRRHYFRGKNLPETVRRVEIISAIRSEYFPDMSLAHFALRFCLSHSAVQTVIPGMRSAGQVGMNCAASDGEYLPASVLTRLEGAAWRKDFWNEEIE